jgi:hypothetical protein
MKLKRSELRRIVREEKSRVQRKMIRENTQDIIPHPNVTLKSVMDSDPSGRDSDVDGLRTIYGFLKPVQRKALDAVEKAALAGKPLIPILLNVGHEHYLDAVGEVSGGIGWIETNEAAELNKFWQRAAVLARSMRFRWQQLKIPWSGASEGASDEQRAFFAANIGQAKDLPTQASYQRRERRNIKEEKMKLRLSELRQIIREELSAMVKETVSTDGTTAAEVAKKIKSMGLANDAAVDAAVSDEVKGIRGLHKDEWADFERAVYDLLEDVR